VGPEKTNAFLEFLILWFFSVTEFNAGEELLRVSSVDQDHIAVAV